MLENVHEVSGRIILARMNRSSCAIAVGSFFLQIFCFPEPHDGGNDGCALDDVFSEVRECVCPGLGTGHPRGDKTHG